MNSVKCIVCGNQTPRSNRTFCSLACRGKWRSKNWLGENHPRWQSGPREKPCGFCKTIIRYEPPGTYAWFKQRKFCSRACSIKGQKRLYGEEHPRYNPNARHRQPAGKHRRWAEAVVNRDGARCQECGVQNVQLHAHHIKPYRNFPDLRWDVSNGVTLCHRCHWRKHSASNANGMNSGELAADHAGDNPEPSVGRKPVEGVTTRGRAYRRWNGPCYWCGTFLSKPWSDVKNKRSMFCSRSCASKHRAATRTYRPVKNMVIPSTAVISSTSLPRESDEMV